MKVLNKKIISLFLLIPFLGAITLCCCLEEKASADETHSDFSMEHHDGSHAVEKADHSEHHEHSDDGGSCACPKHLSFLSADSIDISISNLNQMLAKYLMAHLEFERFALYSSLANQTHGPPILDHARHASLPIYLKISNLRL